MIEEKDVVGLIRAIGKNLTLRVVSGGSYNAATGQLSGGSQTDNTVKGMLLSYSDSQRDGEMVQKGDRKAVLEADTLPSIQDILIDGSDEYEIINVTQIESNDSDLVYVCQIRQ